ncbi:MAG: PQQ-dependent sugar dehydrogenase [Firmicutes bacterium]|nr:PQQ-dependent sugar dehydrogenase [Bacillota bacterium]
MKHPWARGGARRGAGKGAGREARQRFSRKAGLAVLIGLLLVGIGVAAWLQTTSGGRPGTPGFPVSPVPSPAVPPSHQDQSGTQGRSPTAQSPSTSPPAGFGLEQWAGGLRQPLYLTHAPDDSDRVFIVQQGGKVMVRQGGELQKEPFADLSSLITTRNAEQGLLSIAFHPRFSDNDQVFASYTDRNGDSVLARYRAEPVQSGGSGSRRLDPETAEIILAVQQPYGNHNGGLAKFGPDGYLYFGLGDGGSAGDPRGNGQNPKTLLGSLLRLDVNVARGYAIPPDNPFTGGPEKREIWAYGLRNPWRFSFDRLTGDLYIADVGQDNREEVDFQPAGAPGGRNYGWNVWEGTFRHRPGLEPASEVIFPVAEYPTRPEGCAVTGGYVYRGEAVPALRGLYLYGDFCTGTIWGMRQAGGAWRTSVLLKTEMNIASFGEDEDGELYVVDYRGAVYRFVPGAKRVPETLAPPS